jgi:hypothetical protein
VGVDHDVTGDGGAQGLVQVFVDRVQAGKI